MDSEHRSILRRNRVIFAKDLVLEELLQLLVEKSLFSDRMVEAILSKSTTFDKNVEFMNKLPTRGPRAFQAFHEALLETDQHHLANILIPSQNGDISKSSSYSSLFPSTFSYQESTPKKPCDTEFNVTGICVTTPKTLHDNSSNDVSPSSGSESECKKHAHLPVEHMDMDNDSWRNAMQPPSKTIITVPGDLEQLHSSASFEQLQRSAGLLRKNNNHLDLPKTLTGDLENFGTMHSGESLEVTDSPSWHHLQVRPCKWEFFLAHKDHCYRMFKRPKGVALLVSVTQFEPSACLDNRQGGEKDCASLEIMFKQLSYDVYKLENGTACEMRNTLKNFSLWTKLGDYDSCFIVLMSHGENGGIYGRDGQLLRLDDIFNFYSNEKCLLLQNKPKVFLIQACRGDDPDKGTDQLDTPTSKQSLPKSSKRHLNFIEPHKNKLPKISDCLFAYATVSGFAAMRNTERGSWFIQAFTQAVAFHARNKSLLEIMTITNDQVKGREGNSPDSEFHRCKEMPEFTSCLCKQFYFFPGLHQDSLPAP